MKREQASNWSLEFENAIATSGLADDISRCISCGKCTGVCPVAAISPSYNPRQIIREVLLGNYERIVKSEEIWRCFWCANCAATCPSEIKYPLLMLYIRYFSMSHGAGKKHVDPFIRFVTKARKEAVTFQPGKPARLDEIRALRSSLGLAPLRIVSDKGIAEYQKLFEITGTDEWLKNYQETPEVPIDLSYLEGKILVQDDSISGSEREA